MTYAITGIKEGLGPGEQVPLRREIDEWWFSKNENDLNQRTLFLYALQELMALDPEKEKLKSYFAIAGIHGQPLQPWDSLNAKGEWYCAHGTTLFGTWHRPYLSLYEQRLYETMLELIPKKFAKEDQGAMTHAAETWRLPYWDWAAKKPDWDPTNPDNPKNREPLVDLNVPYILTQETVYVKGKLGTAEAMPNPMWKFQLPEGRTFGSYKVTGEEGNFPVCMATSRYPRTDGKDPRHPLYKEWVTGKVQDWAKITGNLRSSKDQYSNTLPELVYRLFTETKFKVPSYPQYVTQKWKAGDPPQVYASLEEVHGKLHYIIGGEGFMSKVGVAAFDPIFWMHHCNIDRLLAMWQELYRDKFDSWLKTPPTEPTYSDPLPDTGLSPFHKDANGTLYKSVDCAKQAKQLGYTYPELEFWLDKYKTNGLFDEQKYRNMLKADIETKYSSTGKAALALKENAQLATVHLSNMTAKNIAIENFPPQVAEKFEAVKAENPQPIKPLQQETWTQNDYVFNVVYDRFALGGEPYVIRVFLGEFSLDESLSFQDTPTQLGLVYNFSGPSEARGMGPEGCEYCKVQEAEHALSAGQVILTDYLIEHVTKQKTLRGIPLRSLDKDQVIHYLKENLHWRVTDFKNVEISREDPRLQDLKVSVALGTATHFGAASHLSVYQDYEVLWEVTENRPAGAAAGELGL